MSTAASILPRSPRSRTLAADFATLTGDRRSVPELPEVEALAAFLRERAVGRVVIRADVAAINAVKTFDPPLSAMYGSRGHRRRAARQVPRPRRRRAAPDHPPGPRRLAAVARAAVAGAAQARPQGPLAFRLHLAPEFDGGPGRPGFDLTEAGHPEAAGRLPRPRPAGGPRHRPARPGRARPSAVDAARRAAARPARADQEARSPSRPCIAGIGNAYSDEILHAARLSPFKIAAKLDRRRDRPRCTTAIGAGARPTRWRARSGRRRRPSRARSAAGCACTPAPGCRARCAATPCARCPSPTSPSSTARPARPRAASSPTAGCPSCCS